jgi:hypothetical protein
MTVRVRTRGGDVVEGSPCGPRLGERGSLARGWWGCSGRGRGPIPPSCSGAVSGVCRTAQRTIKKSATIGIFKKTISQTKVHASISGRSYYESRHPYSPRGHCNQGAPLNWVIARSSSIRATISLPFRRSMRSVPNSSTLKDASTVAWAIARRSS